MLLTALVDKLDAYSAAVANRAETRSVYHLRLYQTAAKCTQHPFIDQVNLSAF